MNGLYSLSGLASQVLFYVTLAPIYEQNQKTKDIDTILKVQQLATC